MAAHPAPPTSGEPKPGFVLTDQGLLLILALLTVVGHTLANGQYGFHRDELDIIMNARRLAWGYVAYPPLTPFLGRLMLDLFGPALPWMRLPAAVAQGVTILLVGLMARDMGARRAAQVLAALAVVFAPMALVDGTMMQYMAFDYLLWVLTAFGCVRLLKTENPRWWLLTGAAIGLAMMNKYAIVFYVAGLIAGVLLTPARRYLRSPWLWAGAGVALLLFLPNLVWQVRHQFISVEFLGSIHGRDVEIGRTVAFLPEQLFSCTNAFSVPLWVAGLVYLFFNQEGKRWRLLGWMYVVTFALLLVSSGRSFYLAAVYPPLFAAGAVWLQGWVERLQPAAARVVRVVTAVLLVVGAVSGVLLAKPVLPINSPVWRVASKFNATFVEMVGWQDLAQQVAGVYATIPETEKERTAILTANYGEAGALELYGPPYSLPRVIGGGNSMWERGYGDAPPETVIILGFPSQDVEPMFEDCQDMGPVTNSYGVENEETLSGNPIFLCRGPLFDWAELWPDFRWFQ